jgi:hypothetical protein
MTTYCFEYAGSIPAGSTDEAYHQFDCPEGYSLVSATGLLQHSGPAIPWSPCTYTGASGIDDDPPSTTVPTAAIFRWYNENTFDLGYQVFLICSIIDPPPAE